jgi:hypothetical protein
MISSITISQDNKVLTSDLMAVHSPLVFLVDVEYSGTDPEILFVDVLDADDTLLGSFKAIPYKDLLPTIRQFMFIADSVLRGYMESFEEFVQGSDTLVAVPDITKQFKLIFSDPDSICPPTELEFVAIHSASQFGSNPNRSDIFNNDPDEYIAIANFPVYVYFYNDDPNNVVTIGDSSVQEVIATDYDDDQFTDFDDRLFLIDIIT